MNINYTLSLSIVLLFLSGCVNNGSYEIDPTMGQSVRQNIVNQSKNTTTIKNDTGLDGKSADNSIIKYQTPKRTPTTSPNPINTLVNPAGGTQMLTSPSGY